MVRSRFFLVLVTLLSLSMLASCARPRGGGGGGGGGGGDDVRGGGDDDDDDDDVRSGWGRNVGDTTMAANIGVGGGDTTLYVVNLTSRTIGMILGWSCDEEDSFQNELDIGRDEYGIIEGLYGDCWYFQAFGADEAFEYSVEDMDGEWTWVIDGGGSSGDDDDDGDDDE